MLRQVKFISMQKLYFRPVYLALKRTSDTKSIKRVCLLKALHQQLDGEFVQSEDK